MGVFCNCNLPFAIWPFEIKIPKAFIAPDKPRRVPTRSFSRGEAGGHSRTRSPVGYRPSPDPSGEGGAFFFDLHDPPSRIQMMSAGRAVSHSQIPIGLG